MIIAIANQKGGVAKTTSTIALAGLLAEEGNCLAIDFDPQGNLTTGLGVKIQRGQPTAYDVLTDESQDVNEALVETAFGIHLLPADVSLAKGEKEILGELGSTSFLKRQLIPMKQRFNHILIDCPPSLGLLTINALAAADAVLIPVQCQFFALEGLRQLLETIKGIRNREVNPQLQILGVLPTMAEKNTLTTQDALTTLKSMVPGVQIFEPVPKSVKFAESNLAREPIHIYSKDSKLVKPYRAVVKELMRLM